MVSADRKLKLRKITYTLKILEGRNSPICMTI